MLRKRKRSASLELIEATKRSRIGSKAEVRAIPVDGYAVYPFEMLEGEELVLTVSATRPVTILVTEEENFTEWRESLANEFDEEKELPLLHPPSYVEEQEVRDQRVLHFYATSSETFVAGVFNMSSKKTRAAIEIVQWSCVEEE
jgi:hypothetical protein